MNCTIVNLVRYIAFYDLQVTEVSNVRIGLLDILIMRRFRDQTGWHAIRGFLVRIAPFRPVLRFAVLHHLKKILLQEENSRRTLGRCLPTPKPIQRMKNPNSKMIFRHRRTETEHRWSYHIRHLVMRCPTGTNKVSRPFPKKRDKTMGHKTKI